MAYRPSEPFTTSMYLIPVTGTEIVKGVPVKKYGNPKPCDLVNCSFKSYGGTESTSNGLYSIIDTATVETWYRPDIKAGSRICMTNNPEKVYEVIGEPENINMRNQFMKFKVQAVRGGA